MSCMPRDGLQHRASSSSTKVKGGTRWGFTFSEFVYKIPNANRTYFKLNFQLINRVQTSTSIEFVQVGLFHP